MKKTEIIEELEKIKLQVEKLGQEVLKSKGKSISIKEIPDVLDPFINISQAISVQQTLINHNQI